MTTDMRRRIENRDEWSNPETWVLCRAALFDPDNAQAWRETAAVMLDDEELSKDRRQLCSALARELRGEYELFCCSHSGLAFDLLELAVTRVDWHEVADEVLLNQNRPHPTRLNSTDC